MQGSRALDLETLRISYFSIAYIALALEGLQQGLRVGTGHDDSAGLCLFTIRSIELHIILAHGDAVLEFNLLICRGGKNSIPVLHINGTQPIAIRIFFIVAGKEHIPVVLHLNAILSINGTTRNRRKLRRRHCRCRRDIIILNIVPLKCHRAVVANGKISIRGKNCATPCLELPQITGILRSIGGCSTIFRESDLLIPRN